jgi:signal transduction histidine kinase
MMSEARESLRAVSERTQQILRTVRRDLEAPVSQKLDLNEVAKALHQQWHQLANQQWKLELLLELAPQPVYIEGDPSHLQQALENLLCNARDATFEERNRQREAARQHEYQTSSERQAGLLAAASWHGKVTLRVEALLSQAALSMQDNGIGMSEETLVRCTEAHFTTKRDNALHEGLASGMGLGLSFVAWVAEQQRGKLEITSKLHQGTTIRMLFPYAADRNPD